MILIPPKSTAVFILASVYIFYDTSNALMNFINFFFKYVLRFRWLYLSGVIFIFLTNYFLVRIPIQIGSVIDLIQEGAELNISKIEYNIFIMLALAVGIFFSRTFSRIIFFNSARKIEFSLKNEVLNHLLKVPLKYFEDNPSGKIISRINNDIHGIRLLFGLCSLQIVNFVFSLSLTPYMMYLISPSLTLYIFLPTIVCFLLMRSLLNRLNSLYSERQEDMRSLSDFTTTSLSGIDVLKTYGIFDWSSERFAALSKKVTDRSKQILLVRSIYNPLLNNLEHIMNLIVFGVGGYYVLNDELRIGGLAAFITYSTIITTLLRGLGWVSAIFQESLVSVRSLNSILDQPIDPKSTISEKQRGVAENFNNHGLTVKNLCFSYDQESDFSLRDINFSIKPGQIVGILGSIGSGKSTLVNCLNGCLTVPNGMLTVGEIDLSNVKFDEWRKTVRTVTQEPFLFSDSVKENIIFGNEAKSEFTSDENVWKDIFYAAALESEIERFPNQGDTQVGEKGIMLSGGQKQRISLARALFSDCGLLILDNVMSAVDYATEKFLIEQILEMNKTTGLLIVSHRTRPVEVADEILVLDKGEIVERGKHADLLKKEGYYYKTWCLQNSESHIEKGNDE